MTKKLPEHVSDAQLWIKFSLLSTIDQEMEFLNGIFSRGFYTRIFSNLSFCLVFYPNFSVLQNAINE